MKKIYLSALSLMFFAAPLSVLSQDKIKDGTVTGSTLVPKEGALLELESNDKALLLTRVSLSATTTWGLNGAAPTDGGYTVYNTNTGITGTVAYPTSPDGIGLYYWDGQGWVAIKQTYLEPWNIQGTTTRAILNNQNIYQTGSVGVGVNTVYEGAKFQVVGPARVGSSPRGVVGAGSFAYGNNTEASGTYSMAGGRYSMATGYASTAIGDSTLASGNYSLATGRKTNATGYSSVTFGQGTTASGSNALAGGLNTTASGDRAVALGNSSTASGNFSVAFGNNSEARGQNSIAFGYETLAREQRSMAFGYGSQSLQESAVAFGYKSVANGIKAVAFGDSTRAIGASAMSFGRHTRATGLYATASGNTTVASGDASFAAGSGTTASGARAAVFGLESTASGSASFAAGNSTVANSANAVALGSDTRATANNAFAMGNGTTASGISATAFGTTTTASGHSSLATGNSAQARGANSVAAGSNAITGVDAQNSFTFGNSTNVTHHNSLVLGRDVSSTENNQFTARFQGGYRFMTQAQSTSNIGAKLDAGANAWSTMSSRALKENFVPVDVKEVLRKVKNLELTSWNYVGQEKENYRHYGPMAEDFFEAFGHDGVGTIGQDDSINQADFDGVNLMAIQALAKENDELKARIERLEKLLLEKK